MSTRLHSVALTDLSTYCIQVAADDAREAQAIAKHVLFEEMTHLPPGAQILKRETEAVAELAAEQPMRHYRVSGTYELQFSMVVPAVTADEAERHAQRLYAVHCGPFEFEHDGGNVDRFTAREIMS